MENDINKKSSPNQMREMMKRVREGKFTPNDSKESKKDLNMRDMLKITRTLNEDVNNKETVYDQTIEEKKIRDFFDDMEVSLKLFDLDVRENSVFWGGVIDGVIQFVYKVTPEDATTGVEFDYLENFSPDNPENEEITGRIKSYFNTFYKYWRDNVINPNKDGEKPTIKLKPDTDQELKSAAE